jgi:hypothetical protein
VAFIWVVYRVFFVEDLALVRQAGEAVELPDLVTLVNSFRFHNPPSGLVRGLLRARISGTRLLTVGRDLFREEPANPAAQAQTS